VKCDEAKPSCERCVSTGRKCDGYAIQEPSFSSSFIVFNISPSQMPVFETNESFRAFDYFRRRSAPVLGDQTDSGFWGGVVLRLSISEPVIRHAVIALSALHEGAGGRSHINLEDKDVQLALVSYGKSIRAMRKWPSLEKSSVVPLLGCILFVCIEFLLEHENTAQLHICQGRKMLAVLEDSKSPSMDMIKRDLVPVYARLGLPSYLFSRYPTPIPQHLRTFETMPLRFASMHEARISLNHFLDDGLGFSTRCKPMVYSLAADAPQWRQLVELQQQTLSRLAHWRTAFSIFLDSTPSDHCTEITTAVLLTYYYTALVWLSTALSKLETDYDAHIASFAALVKHATSIVDMYKKIPLPRYFSFETEVIAPLFWVVTKCRHPTLRRDAMKLLMRDEIRQRRENLWNAREKVFLLARVIEIEEEVKGSPEFVREAPGCQTPERYSGEIHVPISCPPTLPPHLHENLNRSTEEGATSLPGRQGIDAFLNFWSHKPRSTANAAATEQPPSIPAVTLSPSAFEPPFDIPESRRIKGVLVGPREAKGFWMVIFEDPPEGEIEYTITREFITYWAIPV
jgi:hypothetical protein